MLSIIIPFGIWGVAAFLWLTIAGLRVMYLNYQYGDPGLRNLNALLFVLYLFEFLNYVSCVGGLALSGDLGLFFLGYLGFSIALNNGVRRPAPKPAPIKAPAPARSGLAVPRPAFQR